MSTKNFQPFTTLLKKLGFGKDYDDRETKQTHRVAEWSKFTNGRDVQVQLWGDGRHRATHAIRKRLTTLPTDFKTPEEMLEAIRVETERKDNTNFATP